MSNRWSLTLVTDATSEPVTGDDMAAQMRITSNEQDPYILTCITVARQYAETFCMRQFMPATYRLTLDMFPSWECKIPLPPLQSITSITYVDTGGTTQTLGSSLYLVDTDSQPGRVTPAYTTIWPVTRYQMAAVKFTFVAGYATAALVRAPVKHWIKMAAAMLYENRELNIQDVALSIGQSLLESERVLDFSGPLGSSSGVPMSVSAWGGNGWWR